MTHDLKRQDGYVLHFLKELPAWVILGMFTGLFLLVWRVAQDDFIPRIIDGLIGALLTSIVAQRPKPTTTGDTNIDKIDHSIVNTDGEKPKEGEN